MLSDMEAFTTLADLKKWLDITDAANDELLQPLIYQVTQDILAYLSRDTFLLTTTTLYTNGQGNCRLTLPEWPVNSVSAVKVNGQTIGEGSMDNPNQLGFRYDRFNGSPPGRMQKVYLTGYTFSWGQQNVAITYQYGYALFDQQVTPGTNVKPSPRFGAWTRDEGVKTSAGVAMTKVDSTPAVGEYTCNQFGLYSFNASEPGPVLISYSYVPSSIAKACLFICGRRYKERNRLGLKSMSQGGETTTSYDLSAMPEDVRMALNQYKKVFQPC